MALCPFAEHKLIRPGSSDPAIDVVGAILHVDAGNAWSLEDFFRHRSGGIESHFHIREDGVIEQYRDTGYEADANYKANSFIEGGRRKGYVSIETQGFEFGRWNAKQIASIKRLLLWLSIEHDFPLSVCRNPTDPGVGFHTLFGAPSAWTPVSKSCPGPFRKVQFRGEIVPWFDTAKTEEDELPEPKDLWDYDLNEYVESSKRDKAPARVLLAQTHKRSTDALAHSRRAERAIKALAKALGAEVEAAVNAALADSVEFDVTVSAKTGDEK